MIHTLIGLTRWQKGAILWVVDVLCIPSAFLIAVLVMMPWARNGPVSGDVVVLIGALSVLGAALAWLTGRHRQRLKEYDRAAMVVTAAQAALLATGNAAVGALFDLNTPAGFSVLFGLLLFALMAGSRIVLLHLLVLIYARSGSITRVLIYGAGRSGLSLATALRSRSDILTVAFLDDNVALRDQALMGIPVYPFVDLPRLLSHQKVDRVILAMSEMSPEKELWVTHRLTALGLEVQALPAFAQLIGEGDLVAKLRRKSVDALIQRETVGRFADEGLNAYRDRAVMVTGAGGSIGIELCRQVLQCRPRCLVLFELSEIALYAAEKELSQRASGVMLVPVLGSVADAPLIERTLLRHEIDTVFHAAAYKHVPMVEENPHVGIANNTFGTDVIARAARSAGVARFVLVSTDKAVRPANVMGASKRLAELVLQDLATRPQRTVFSIVRFGNVLGSSGSVVPRFREQIERGGPVTLTHPDVERYFMTVEEAAHLVIVAGSIAQGGDVFVLDMGAPVAIGELARRMIEGAGYTLRDAGHPDGDIEVVVTGLRPGEKLREELMIGNRAEPTPHPKIIRVREDHLSQIEMAAALRDLREAVRTGDDAALIAAVVRRIPESSPPLGAGVAPRLLAPPVRPGVTPKGVGKPAPLP